MQKNTYMFTINDFFLIFVAEELDREGIRE